MKIIDSTLLTVFVHSFKFLFQVICCCTQVRHRLL